MIQEIAQWALLPVLGATMYSFWRLESYRHAGERIQQAQRREIAKHKRAIERMTQINNRNAELIRQKEEILPRLQQRLNKEEA